MNFILIFLSLFAFSTQAQLFFGSSPQSVSIEYAVSQVEKGDIIVIGELHNHPVHQENQRHLLKALKEHGLTFDVGMEFFYDYRKQPFVDTFLKGDMDEVDFLDRIGLTPQTFLSYKPQVLAPLEVGGWTYAINAAKELTRALAAEGLDNLPEDLKKLLPDQFELGNEDYLQRFREILGGDHFPPEKLENYFAAQSAWDDVMAWQSLKYFSNSQSDVLVIIVGNFHAQYEGGLPQRLRSRGAHRVVTFSQVDSTNLSQDEIESLVSPSDLWGPQGSFVWASPRPSED